MEFREVRSLAALGKLQSIAKTAEQMSLTPAAVHKQLKNLEAEFGVRLYEKTGRAVHLTEAAKTILPYVDDLAAQYEAIFAALKEWKGVQRGFVRIGANPAVSTDLTPRLLRKFRQQWPGVSPVLEVGTSPGLAEGVANRSLDLAMGLWTESDRQKVETRVRWEYELLLVANHPDVPERARLPELAHFPFVRPPQGTYLSDVVEAYFEKYGAHPSEVMVVNNAHTILAMVRVGLGLAMLPKWAVASDLRAGTLRVVRQEEPPLLARLELITARSRYMPPAVKAFVDLARASRWRYMRLVEQG